MGDCVDRVFLQVDQEASGEAEHQSGRQRRERLVRYQPYLGADKQRKGTNLQSRGEMREPNVERKRSDLRRWGSERDRAPELIASDEGTFALEVICREEPRRSILRDRASRRERSATAEMRARRIQR